MDTLFDIVVKKFEYEDEMNQQLKLSLSKIELSQSFFGKNSTTNSNLIKNINFLPNEIEEISIICKYENTVSNNPNGIISSYKIRVITCCWEKECSLLVSFEDITEKN